jgi:hypothetical protein
MSMVDDLNSFLTDLKALRSDIRKEDVRTIGKQNLRQRANQLSRDWFSKYRDPINRRGVVSTTMLEELNQSFSRLLRLSSPSNLRESYLDVLNGITRSFKNDIIVPLAQNPVSSKSPQFAELVGDTAQMPEADYLDEAIQCADSGFFRAAAVLGWSAGVYRLRLKIAEIGFDIFNTESVRISGITSGRFKRFNKRFNVSSMNEMNEVFDTDLLWILEGMELIDLNEHTRLKSCFDLRCQSAHPGDAPVTPFNLLSFFSDLKEIIFKNEKFQISSTQSHGQVTT